MFNSPSTSVIAATRDQGSTNYFSPNVGARISVEVTDASGQGVNGQTVLVTVDKGFILSGFNVAGCPGTNKALTATTSSAAPAQGATAKAGIVQLTVCADQEAAPGQITLTAQNISTSMANATTTVTMAGRQRSRPRRAATP